MLKVLFGRAFGCPSAPPDPLGRAFGCPSASPDPLGRAFGCPSASPDPLGRAFGCPSAPPDLLGRVFPCPNVPPDLVERTFGLQNWKSNGEDRCLVTRCIGRDNTIVHRMYTKKCTLVPIPIKSFNRAQNLAQILTPYFTNHPFREFPTPKRVNFQLMISLAIPRRGFPAI